MMLDAIRAAAQVFRNQGIVRHSKFGFGVRDLGHHIGLETLDSRDFSMPLEAGMVFTVEPKIYIPEKNLAIMIEDVILVTKDGYENLSASAPRDPDEIERIMAATHR